MESVHDTYEVQAGEDENKEMILQVLGLMEIAVLCSTNEAYEKDSSTSHKDRT